MKGLCLLISICVVTLVYSSNDSLHSYILNRAVRKIAFLAYEEAPERQDFSHLEESHIVQTTYGPVKGFLSITTRDGTPYSGFVGIPYAKPPIGELRFKAPVPPEPWTEVRSAVTEGHPCPGNGGASEDCLVLNVFTPITSADQVAPLKGVLLFIHGGGFLGGSSSVSGTSPHFYIDKDVIFVSINYRLGPLGFLSLQNENVPGNAGLKDQTLAIKWVKENIEYFGGDPNKIVIFGESAGSASVAYLHLSPTAQGLFSGAILQSGTSIGPWNYLEPDISVKNAFRLGKLLGCDADIDNENGKDDLWECLMKTDPITMCDLQIMALPMVELSDLRLFPFLPTMEPELEGAFITKSPYDMLAAGEFNDVPMIIGVNSREGLFMISVTNSVDPFGWFVYLIGLDMTRFVPYDLHFQSDSSLAPEVEQRIRNFYFDRGEITHSQRLRMTDMVTDSHFNIDIQRSVNAIAKHSNSSIWNYQFTYDGPFNLKVFTDLVNVPGVVHADEIGYLMNTNSLQNQYALYSDRNSTPQLTIDRVVEMWTNFAKFGSPTPTLDGYVKTEWKPFTTSEHNYLDIGETLELKQGLASERMRFWNDIFELINNTKPLPE